MCSGEPHMEIHFVPGGRETVGHATVGSMTVLSRHGILAHPVNRVSAQDSVIAFFKKSLLMLRKNISKKHVKKLAPSSSQLRQTNLPLRKSKLFLQ